MFDNEVVQNVFEEHFSQNQEQNINQTLDTKKITCCMAYQNKKHILAREN